MASRQLVELRSSQTFCGCKPYRLCSNRAATRVNVLKGREMRQYKNMAICRNSASSRNLQQTIVLPSHGRGRWFEPSIAHSQSTCKL